MINLVDLIYAVQHEQNADLRRSEDLKFIGECLSNAADTKSQNYQDVFVLRETNFKKNGYFVEFGATDGITISNTALLEKTYGWKGIVAEPNPVYHERLHANRVCDISDMCVYSTSGDTLEFVSAPSPDLSTIKGFGENDEHAHIRSDGSSIQVKTISLVDLLDKYNAPNNIDYLSIDTEGSEYVILDAFFKSPKDYQFRIITVEHNYVPEMMNKLVELLTGQGYKLKFPGMSRCDYFFVKDIE